jgi:hypothetical protein
MKTSIGKPSSFIPGTTGAISLNDQTLLMNKVYTPLSNTTTNAIQQ